MTRILLLVVYSAGSKSSEIFSENKIYRNTIECGFPCIIGLFDICPLISLQFLFHDPLDRNIFINRVPRVNLSFSIRILDPSDTRCGGYGDTVVQPSAQNPLSSNTPAFEVPFRLY